MEFAKDHLVFVTKDGLAFAVIRAPVIQSAMNMEDVQMEPVFVTRDSLEKIVDSMDVLTVAQVLHMENALSYR
jgi:hypothetical protein